MFGPTGHLQVCNMVSRSFQVTATAAGSFAEDVFRIYGLGGRIFSLDWCGRTFWFQFTLHCGWLSSLTRSRIHPPNQSKTYLCIILKSMSRSPKAVFLADLRLNYCTYVSASPCQTHCIVLSFITLTMFHEK